MSEPVDTANLEMLKEVIGDDLKEILQSFIEITPQTVDKIDSALNSLNATDLRLHSHSLKGSAANIGANALSALSYGIEMKAKEGITSGMNAELKAIKQETVNVLAFLNDYLQQF